MILSALIIGGAAGMAGTVYRLILAYEPIMAWWFRFGNRYEGRWFFPPIWGCQLCISGQLAGWSFLFLEILPIILTETGRISRFGGSLMISIQTLVAFLFSLIIAICAAIFTAKLISKVINN